MERPERPRRHWKRLKPDPDTDSEWSSSDETVRLPFTFSSNSIFSDRNGPDFLSGLFSAGPSSSSHPLMHHDYAEQNKSYNSPRFMPYRYRLIDRPERGCEPGRNVEDFDTVGPVDPDLDNHGNRNMWPNWERSGSTRQDDSDVVGVTVECTSSVAEWCHPRRTRDLDKTSSLFVEDGNSSHQSEDDSPRNYSMPRQTRNDNSMDVQFVTASLPGPSNANKSKSCPSVSASQHDDVAPNDAQPPHPPSSFVYPGSSESSQPVIPMESEIDLPPPSTAPTEILQIPLRKKPIEVHDVEENEEVIIVDDRPTVPTEGISIVEQNFSLGRAESRGKKKHYVVKENRPARVTSEDLNKALIQFLECPVCLEFMTPPIHQCRRGHLLCSSCKPKLPSCPTCRTRLTDMRNLAMEKVADKLEYPCKNQLMGCDLWLRLKDKDEHEANCLYRSYRCILQTCEWKGKQNQILDHMIAAHKQVVKYGNNLPLKLKISNPNQNWIISAHDELFRVNFLSSPHRTQLHGCVQFIGPCRKAEDFIYSFKAEMKNGKTSRTVVFQRTTHNDMLKCSHHYSNGDAFSLRSDTADLFSQSSNDERFINVQLLIEKFAQ